MESRAKTIILGILTLATLAGCSGGDDAAGGDDSSMPPAADGGLDGGGLIGVGLPWDKGVFAQAIWVDGQPRMLVSNRRAEDVSFGVFTAEWEGQASIPGARLLEEAVPAYATRVLDAGALLGALGDLLWIGVDGERLGFLYRPQPPAITATLPVVSNDFSVREPIGQLETDFSVLPGTTFEATLTLTHPGELWEQPSSSPTPDVEFLIPTEVTSADALVTSTTDGFRVEVPAETSEASPARVQLSFSVPSVLSTGSLVALNPGFFCNDPQHPSGCGSGANLIRFVPAP